MVYLKGIERVRRNNHGDNVRIDAPVMKDDAVEWAGLIVPWLIWLHERFREFVEVQVWVVGMEQEIILNLSYVLTLVV